MYTPKVFIAFLFAFSATASPVPGALQAKRALTAKAYNDFQVSDGVAGNALAEVNQAFPVDLSDLTKVSAADIKVLSDARSVSNSAEQAYVDALATATGTTKDALQNGLIKNKGLRDQKAGTTQLQDIQEKLANNVQIDQQHAGEASQSVPFAG